jgi:hypothetical protein
METCLLIATSAQPRWTLEPAGSSLSHRGGHPSIDKTVASRYRIFLESQQLAPVAINDRSAAVRRLAYDAPPL